MAKQQSIFSLKTFCVITGASKGLGQTIAIKFSQLFPDGSFFLLPARSKEGLDNTKQLILKQKQTCTVCCVPVDLSKGDEVQIRELLKDTLKQNSLAPANFEQAFVVHNAGSLGDVSKNMLQQSSMRGLQEYWGLNLSSVLVLNSVFLELFKENTDCKLQVMNISSICALQPFKSWSVYCAGME